MKPWKRLLFYLALNVVVSACTVLGVLFAWDQLSGPMPRDLLPKALAPLRRDATPTPEAANPSEPVSLPTPTEAFEIYQVKSGDTFDSIAGQYGVSVDELIAVNGFKRNQPLGEGEMLRIPIRPSSSVVIDSVIGAGDLESEHVVLEQRGEGELSLVGWRLDDGQGNIFVFPQFPQLILYEDGAVNIYTKAGSNTVIELFWGLDQAVWQSGDTISLKDAQGNVRASYQVP